LRATLEIVKVSLASSKRCDGGGALVFKILVNGIVDDLIADQIGILADKRRRYAMLWIVRTQLCDRDTGIAE
jgi:hypothetical protein